MALETGNNSSYLPEGLDGIRNENDFINIYKDIKSWYGENFSSSDIKLIKDSRNASCAEYGGVFNETRRAIARNRIDSILFRLNYPSFCDLDKNYIMRTLSNANTQRNFRDIIIKLENKFGEIYTSEVGGVETRLQNEIKKKPRSDSTIFETIYEDLSNMISSNRNTPDEQGEGGLEPNNGSEGMQGGNNDLEDGNVNSTPEIIDNDMLNIRKNWKNAPGHIPQSEIKKMLEIKIPTKEFEDMKKVVFSHISFDELGYCDKDGNKKQLSADKINEINEYASAIYNDFADKFFKSHEGKIPPSFYKKPEVILTIMEYTQDIVCGKETSAKNLVKKLEDVFFDDDEMVNYCIDELHEESRKIMNKLDPEELEKITITEEELKDIKINLRGEDKEVAMEKLIYSYKVYKYLKQRKTDLSKLEPDQEKLLEELDTFFANLKRRVLREISSKDIHRPFDYGFGTKSLQISSEYATGNIKDIKPAAIVENNKQINHFVYGDNEPWIGIDRNISLSQNERKRLFSKIKEQKKGDKDFMECIEYLDVYGNIDREKAIADNIDPISLVNNKRKIDEMIRNLAIEEKRNNIEKERIRDISVRRSIMISCFRAISSFFDTVNNNSENFASEFEIQDVNENIEFNEETGIIKMTGTIGANKNHIGLYYNTKTGELSFDNFLAYDPEVGYKIGKGNGEKEPLKVTLPTMKEMESRANSIDFNLIDRLSLNINQYRRMVGIAMGESIRFNCFKGFMGADMEVNKQFVAQFTEKNILKQDVIKCIYKKFYNTNDLDDIFNNDAKYLTIGEGNEPEQFKLIKLISDSIDYYQSADQLLNFRLYINQLDEFLSSKKTIERDKLLRALFADNLSSDSDNLDISREIMQNENENLSLSEDNTVSTYTSQEQTGNRGNKKLGDYILLDLLSENKGGNRIINLDRFGYALNTMGRADDGSSLLDMAEEFSGFEKNLQKHANDLPDFQTEMLQESIDQIV